MAKQFAKRLAAWMAVLCGLVACGGGSPAADGQASAMVEGLRCSGLAQSGWCWQEPRPFAHASRDIFFVDAQNGWMVGDAGSILHTADGGANWAEQSSGQHVALGQVRFADPGNGWAVASGSGLVLRTRDGGAHWTRAPDVPVDRPTHLWVLDHETLIVTGTTGLGSSELVSAVSIDGGAHWRASALAVTGVAANRTLWGYMPTGWGKSTDLGLTAMSEPAWPAGYELWWRDVGRDGLVWALLKEPGGPQYLYRSSDGGRTWASSRVVLPPGSCGSTFFKVTLYQNGMGWGWANCDAAEGAVWLRTTDGGQSWSPVAIPAAVPLALDQVASLEFIDERSLWIGTQGEAPGAYLSTDAGRSWRLVSQPGEAGLAKAIERDGAGALVMSHGDAATYIQRRYRSLDDGVIWSRLPYGTKADDGIAGLWFMDAQRGLAITQGGVMLDTVDGGRHWIARAERLGGPYAYVSGLQFTPDGTGWMMETGRLRRSTDGGLTWPVTNQPDPGNPGVRTFRFLTDRVAWALVTRCEVGGGFAVCPSSLYVTADGGTTWQQRPGVIGELDVPMAFATPEIGVRDDGITLWRTADGGRSWTALPAALPSSTWARHLSFSDPSTGWMLTSRGTVLRSTDAGLTWSTVNTPVPSLTPWGFPAQLLNIGFSDRQHGWIVGEGGLVWATNDGGANWSAQQSGTQESLFQVFAIDGQRAWLGGSHGVIFGTATGGR